jgi:predicted nuclease with TOPRIM domain
LTRNRAAQRMMEAAQSERVSELQRPNTELRAKLEQTHLKIAKIEEHQNSLHSGYTKLEDECEVLRHAAESLKRES